MNQTTPNSAPLPWFLIIGLLAGVAFVAYIVWDSAKPPPGHATSENVVELTTENWQREVIESNVPVFVDFTASWCPPCKAFAPTVSKLADRYKGKIKVAKFDVGDNGFSKAGDLPSTYGFNAIPHVLIFMPGSSEPVQRFKGGPSENQVARVFDKLLASQ